ncbi:hypothetical protein ACHHYP_07877 [Achlya hypogyna]|uniref:Uncharacterized protein n=1 Tax=Achlya hypogyna TaxID=1202772 RepID=A0A1V9ZLE1_ACHHY|nr:hypothetical protein ACHHYP_07877 [Achlya hypogyna]
MRSLDAERPLPERCVLALLALLEREGSLLFRRPPSWPQVRAALKACTFLIDLTRLHAASARQHSSSHGDALRLLLAGSELLESIAEWLAAQGNAAMERELSAAQRRDWLRTRLELVTDVATCYHTKHAVKEALVHLYKGLDLQYGLLDLALADGAIGSRRDILFHRVEMARAHVHIGAVAGELAAHDAAAFHARTAASVLFDSLVAATTARLLEPSQRDEWAVLLGRALFDFSVHREQLHEVADALQACRKAYEITAACVGKHHPRAERIWKRLDSLTHPLAGAKAPQQRVATLDVELEPDPWRAAAAWKWLLQSFGYVSTVPEKPQLPLKPTKKPPTPRPVKPIGKPDGVGLTGCPTPRPVQFSPVLRKDLTCPELKGGMLSDAIVSESKARRPQSAVAACRGPRSPPRSCPKRPRPQVVSSSGSGIDTAAGGRQSYTRAFGGGSVPKPPNEALLKTKIELRIADADGSTIDVALAIAEPAAPPYDDARGCDDNLVHAVVRGYCNSVVTAAVALASKATSDEASAADRVAITHDPAGTASIAVESLEHQSQPPTHLIRRHH